MPLPTPSRSQQRYLGDSNGTVHDLLNEQPECGALQIISAKKGERFTPDRLEYALSLGYRACPHCLPAYAVPVEPVSEEPASQSAETQGEAEPADPRARGGGTPRVKAPGDDVGKTEPHAATTRQDEGAAPESEK